MALDLDRYRATKYNGEPGERVSVITVRLPASMQARLKEIAWRNKVSLNSLCLAALSSAGDELAAGADSAVAEAEAK